MSGVLCRLVSLATWFGMFIVLVCSDGELRFSVVEEMPAGSFVGNVILGADLTSQHDAYTLRQFHYGILPPTGETEVSLFTVDETEGIISTKTRVDREQLCPHKAQCSVSLDVTVSGPNDILTIGVQVDILDINDNIPTFPEHRITIEIPESAAQGVHYNLPLATDLDNPMFGIQKYELISGSAAFDLKVITVMDVPRNLQLLLNNQLDREDREFYAVTLMAYDGGQPSRTGSLLVDVVVTDANDHKPQFVVSAYEISVAENHPVQTKILTVQALDQDTGVNAQITYHIVPGSTSATIEMFGIVEATGDIFVREPLDYEKEKEYDLVVEARDGGDNSQPAYTAVTIYVEDVNDNAPQITVNTHSEGNTAEILETAEVGTFVAHFLVRDQDAGQNGNFSCHVRELHFLLQQQDRSQYRLVTAIHLDRENQEYFQLTIMCQDDGSPSLTSSVEISVQVLDVNDNPPVFSQHSYSGSIQENNHIEAFVIQVTATDLDLDDNAKIMYHLHPDVVDYFRIDPDSGFIHAVTMFDYEKVHEKSFWVAAVDGGSPSLSSSVLVTVSVSDANDEAPVFSQDYYMFDVLENEPAGTEIGIVSAVDPDSEPFSHFEFSLAPGGSADLFDIDAESGQLITRAALDHEEQSVYFVTVIASNTGDTIPLSSSATITVQVLDSNDNAPIITFPSADNHTVAVSNKVPVGYQITQVEAFDVDQRSNGLLTYAIDDHDQNSGFYIDSSTGTIGVGVRLEHMESQVFEIEIIVSDLGFPPMISKQNLSISVNNSIIFMSPESQTSDTNLTLVVGLTATFTSMFLISLVVILVLHYCRRQDQQKHVYQCRIEEQKVTQEIENREKSLNAEQSLQDCSLYSEAKPANSVDMDLIYDTVNLPKYSSGNLPIHGYNIHQSWPAGGAAELRKTDHKPSRSTKGPSQNIYSPSPVHLTTQQKSWDFPTTHSQVEPKTRVKDDTDSDSMYSGDLSNPDSGRGPSEEGDHHTYGVSCGRFPGQTIHHSEIYGRSPHKLFPLHHAGIHDTDNKTGALPVEQYGFSGKHIGSANVLPVHVTQNDCQQDRFSYHGNSSKPHWLPGMSYATAPIGENSHVYSLPRNFRQYQEEFEVYKPGINNESIGNCSSERPGTPSEDFPDNASSTSGSYILDSNDVYRDVMSDVYPEAFETTSYMSVEV